MSNEQYLRNQALISGADSSRLKEPQRKGCRRIDTDKAFDAYLNANDFTDAAREDLIEQYYDQGFIEVDE